MEEAKPLLVRILGHRLLCVDIDWMEDVSHNHQPDVLGLQDIVSSFAIQGNRAKTWQAGNVFLPPRSES